MSTALGKSPAQSLSPGQASFITQFGNRLFLFVGNLWRPLALLLGVFFLWWLLTNLQIDGKPLVKPYLVPTPDSVRLEFVENGGLLWKHSAVTINETLVGFVAAILFGLFSAIIIVFSPTVEKTLYPILIFAQVIPKIAIAPLFVVWLGFGPEPKIVVAVLIAFFPIVISGVTGLRAVDPELLELAATMGANPVKTFLKIRFPAALPHLFAGIKVAATLAVVGAVVGEFVGANEGLGYILLLANGNLDSSLLFAGLFVMSFIGIVMFVAIEIAERILLPWYISRRSTNYSATI